VRAVCCGVAYVFSEATLNRLNGEFIKFYASAEIADQLSLATFERFLINRHTKYWSLLA
jgi:hypothetical protein